MKLHPQVI